MCPCCSLRGFFHVLPLLLTNCPVKWILTSTEKRELVSLIFTSLWLMYYLSWFVCSSSWYLGITIRLCSLIVTSFGQLLSRFSRLKWPQIYLFRFCLTYRLHPTPDTERKSVSVESSTVIAYTKRLYNLPTYSS